MPRAARPGGCVAQDGSLRGTERRHVRGEEHVQTELLLGVPARPRRPRPWRVGCSARGGAWRCCSPRAGGSTLWGAWPRRAGRADGATWRLACRGRGMRLRVGKRLGATWKRQSWRCLRGRSTRGWRCLSACWRTPQCGSSSHGCGRGGRSKRR